MTDRSVVLIGPMGAGKTSVGRKTAKALGVEFFDTDMAISRVHGPVAAIFATHGEAQFRRWERDAVREGLAGSGVVALGGGAVLHPDTQADLAQHPVVLLTVDPRIVAARIRNTTRPLLQGGDAMTQWQNVAAERHDLYARLADVTFDTSTGHIRDIVAAVADWVRDRWEQDAATTEGIR